MIFTLFYSLLLILNISHIQEISTDKKYQSEQNIQNLNWLSGYWSSEIDGIKMEEFWLSESGNLMLGLHRDLFKSGKTFYEFLRISHSLHGISYFASPKGKEATEFPLIEMSANKVTFENKEHDFPQRIIYALKNETTLWVRIEGIVSGELKFQEWNWYKNEL
ncbi:DUF6265 family protein [Calditrichota bacterium]